MDRARIAVDDGVAYVAWLDGTVTGEHGTLEQPLRADAERRPGHTIDLVSVGPRRGIYEETLRLLRRPPG